MLALILFISVLKIALCQPRPSNWNKLEIQCFANNTSSMKKVIAKSEFDCVIQTEIALQTGLIIAQFHKPSRLCSMFSYQSACQFTVYGGSVDCVSFQRFSMFNLPAIYSKLSSLWVADGMSKLENLVCQMDKDTNRFSLINTVWTSDGLKFDGSSSHMVLNKSSLGFTGGLTWLLRIKRMPQVQPYFEIYECSTMTAGGYSYNTHMWESPGINPRAGYIKLNRITGPYSSPLFQTNAYQLSGSADEWINFGFTTDRQVTNPQLFYNNSFVPTVQTPDGTTPSVPLNVCVMFGRRLGDDAHRFSGTLRALAFANTSMSEAEIQQFFAMVI